MEDAVMKKIILAVLMMGWVFSGHAQDRTYKITVMYEADEQGKILTQQPYTGWVILKADGTYNVRVNQDDQGKYTFSAANANQPNDTIFFYSQNNYRYFAYPRGNMIALWLNKPRPGVNLWVNAELTTGTGSTAAAPAVPSLSPTSGGLYQQGLIKNGRFTKLTMFTTTSAGYYFYYDESTGNFSHDQTGVVFRPNGTYALRAQFGSSITSENGTYTINGREVTITFSDNSAITLTIADNGKDLHWYTNGMLISEFFFLSAK
jgi:hypothetical protein